MQSIPSIEKLVFYACIAEQNLVLMLSYGIKNNIHVYLYIPPPFSIYSYLYAIKLYNNHTQISLEQLEFLSQVFTNSFYEIWNAILI